ncbi:kinetochore scaffold 1 isoform X2 [Melanotaenia boesemani]|uniref:kinetochore scaffold 1 isoform X2 n=1 Tax=Melanotaenia boesemani TaxID=1250792 RepID=UPI001C040DC4|nr:kinetochore scaffold 1 isoform X2 [Melanotaenia boesemani]
MEPLDPAKNAEGSGFSKRRISSILKAPRKSTICRDPEQQENKVENTRPLEKRNSRRVSFAPANDVLLFAKDAKNASPARSPLQELMAAAAATTQNRLQEPEDGNQQIKGIENLLNAPLHASQQRDVVNFDTGNDFGEKTVTFSMEDAVMDMTHSHTINIANDAELLGDISMQNYDILAGEDRKVTVDQSTDVSLSHIVNMKSGSVPIPTGRGSDLSVEKRNLSSKLPCLDPGFENFLASLSKPSTDTVTTRMIPFAEPSSDETSSSLFQNKTQRADVDKENQVPKSHNSSRKIGESFERHAFCPEGDVDMDISEAQTGRILGVGDDPFQCLFPIEAMCAHTDKITSQMTEIQQQQSSKMLGSSDLKEKKSFINPLLHAPHQRPIVISDPKDKCREKTIIFTADDECLDMTQSHTVNIASSSLAPVQSSANTLDAGFNNFLASLSRPSDPSRNPDTHRRKPITSPTSKTTNDANSSLSQHKTPRPRAGKENCLSNTSGSIRKPFSGGITGTKDDTSLDLTETQTGRVPGLTGSDDPFQFLIPSEDVYPLSESRKQADVTSRQQSSGFRFPNHQGMETSIKPSVKLQLQRQQEKPEIEDDHEEKTVRFSAEDACMDVTQSQTVNIFTDLKLQLYHNVDLAPSCGEKTVRFTVDDAPMDMTQCLTVNIDSNLVSDSVPSVRKQEIKTCGPPQHGSSSTHHSDSRFSNPLTNTSKPSVKSYDGFAICPKDDVSIDMTEVHIAEGLGTDDPLQCLLTTKGMRPQSVNLKKTEMTSQQQSNEATGTSKYKAMETSVQTSLKTKLQRQVTFDAEDEGKEKTVRFTFDDACIDMTRSHTLNIATDLNMLQHQNMDLLLANRKKTMRLPAGDTSMDVTRRHTSNIVSRLPQQSYQSVDRPAYEEKTVRFTADDASMDVTRSHTVNIATDLNMLQHQNVDLLLANRKKTTRLPADDTSMDVTKRHTLNIVSRLPQQSYQTVDRPAYEEKTVRFTADDATMDVTRSHTVNIATDLNMLQHQNVDLIPANSEKTVRFTADDATMDVTRSHTVNIATDINAPSEENLNLISANREKMAKKDAMDVTRSPTVNASTDLNLQSYQNVLPLSTNGEKNRYSANDETMDVTRSHTVNIAAKFDPKLSQNVALLPNNPEKPVRLTASNTSVIMSQSQTVNMMTDVDSKLYQNMDFVPTCGERTTSTTNDATMDMTRSLTVNIASNSASGLVLTSEKFPLNRENLNFPVGVKKSDNETCVPHSNRPSLAYGVNQEFDNSLYKTTSEAADTLFPQETDSNVVLVPLKPDMSTENEASSLVLPVMEKTVNKTTDCPEISVNMDMTKVQTCSILEQMCTDDTSQSLSSAQGPTSDLLLKAELTSQNNGALGSPISDDAEIKNPPDSLDSNETETIEENEPAPTAYQSQKMGSSPSTVDQDGDASRSRKSRRMSLANLQSKVRRLSHIINTAPDAMAIDSCTAPLPQLNQDLNKNSNDETTSLPEVELELEMVNLQDNTQAFGLKQAEQLCATSTATPFNLKTKTLISRLSVGGFKPKLPQRDNTERTKKMTSGEPTKTVTVNITSQLNNSDNVSDIYDEELGSYEDISETLETRSPDKNFEKEGLFYEFNMFEPLEENVFEEESVRTVHGQKRSLPEDEDNKEDEKRLKASTKFTELTPQSDAVEFDRDKASTRTTTHTIDFSSTSHTASRCEAACESTIKNSLFESQIEDYDSDAQNKLEDGTITVLEFFKLFNIDFVIHNPRQSIVAGKLQSDTDTKPLDLLKGRHISLPKQLVYKMDIKTLTEKVEGLKVRMRDLDKPLKTVNRHLWEEMRRSSEKEMKSFGAKLKEQNNFFRKTSKIQSHEMKEVLYSTLVRANQEEQQKLRGTIEEADGMIKSLDECICELEAELAAVEENGSEEKPSLASLQEETNNVTEALADKSRQISELEMQKTQNLSKLNRLKAETMNLESHINMLNMVNEWKLREKRENCTVYAFLHETMLLQLVFEKADDTGSEQKVTDIAFKLELDDEKSDFYAHLVHKLVSKFIERESAWVEKYPTQRHVPKLLRDVSLVVSRCRLLGEELRLLKMWGGLRLNILDISCMDTRLHIVFSSLKKCSKFEVVFATSLIDQLCVLHVESFKNMIGSTTMQQIEEIVASFTPGKNLLTKIVRKIHNTLLS